MRYCKPRLIVAISILFGVNTVFGSQDSIGPNGIHSNVLSLTGNGVEIGQVEIGRPGDPNFDTGSPTLFNTTVDPAMVYNREFVNFQATANRAAEITPHAVDVAGIMISTDGTATGVAPEADLYSVAIRPDGIGGIEGVYSQAAESAQFLATLSGHDISIINLSFLTAGGMTGANGADGKSKLTSFFDWSAGQHDVLYVAAGYESGGSGVVPSDNFNGITVGASDKDGGVYRRVGVANSFIYDAVGNRSLIDIIAPSRDVEVARQNNAVMSIGAMGGTSFAAPHVAGTAALLRQHAQNQIQASAPRFGANALHHEVAKAVILNSADKLIDNGTVMVDGNTVPQGGLLGMERTVLKQDGVSTWLDSDAFDDFAPGTGGIFFDGGAFALDTEMGAGHLNAKRAVQQFIPGEYEADTTPVPPIGWDFGTTSGTNDINKYAFNQQMTAGDFISVTLAWDRKVEFDIDNSPTMEFNSGDTFKPYTIDDPNADDVISDLQLYLVPSGSFTISDAVALSVGEGTVQHIFFPIPTTDTYEIWVRQLDDDAGAQDYGLAWWYGVAPLPVVQGDFDSDGDVDGADFLAWQRGNSPTPLSASDLADWQTGYGGGSLTVANVAVPEPKSVCLLATVSVLGLRRRWQDCATRRVLRIV